MKKKEISIIINARIQSGRLKNKLIRPFGETCLLRLALERLNQLTFAKHRFLCIAEEELIEYSEALTNIDILWRKKESVSKGDVGLTVFEHYQKVPTLWFMIMNPSHPFVSIESYRRAYEIFQSTDFNSYTSVTKKKAWIFDHNGDPLTNKDPAVTGTKQGKYCYEANHAFHIINRDYFIRTGKHWDMKKNSPHLIEIPEYEALDIDEPAQFNICELLYENGYPGKNFLQDNFQLHKKQTDIIHAKGKQKRDFIIGPYNLDNSERTLIIAGIGFAHNGKLKDAHRFIDEAANIGVDAVKFQVDTFNSKKKHTGKPSNSLFRDNEKYINCLKKVEFNENEWTELKEHSSKKGLLFICSPFSNAAVDLMRNVGVSAFKIASGEINNKEMLHYICDTGLPVILSTGMSCWNEIDDAVNILNQMNNRYAILQSSSYYPCPPEKVGLNVISELKERYYGPIGFSSHSYDVIQCITAVCSGARIIEFQLSISEIQNKRKRASAIAKEDASVLVEQIRKIDILKTSNVYKDQMAYDMIKFRDFFCKSSFVINSDTNIRKYDVDEMLSSYFQL